MNDATNYVKIEKVQAILDWNWPRAIMSKYAKPHIANIDAAIVRLLKQVFEAVDPNLPVTIDVEVRKGRIKSLQTTPRELHVLLGGGIEGRHAHGRHAAKSNLLSDVGK